MRLKPKHPFFDKNRFCWPTSLSYRFEFTKQVGPNASVQLGDGTPVDAQWPWFGTYQPACMSQPGDYQRR
jgi:hypothetical protein